MALTGGPEVHPCVARSCAGAWRTHFVEELGSAGVTALWAGSAMRTNQRYAFNKGSSNRNTQSKVRRWFVDENETGGSQEPSPVLPCERW